MIKIYSLIDPIDGLIKYVGKTKGSLKRRLQNHECSARRSKVRTLNNNWIKGLLVSGLTPSIQLIEEVVEDVWEEREKYWIVEYKQRGFILKNMTIGGDRGGDWSGKQHTEETKKKIAIANTGEKNGFYNKTHSEGHKQTLKNLGKERVSQLHTPEVRLKLSNHIKTETHRKNISKANSNNSKLNKQVIQINKITNEPIKIWKSIKEAAANNKTHEPLISAVCRGKNYSAGGFKWSYL